jgi:hypothetical protein
VEGTETWLHLRATGADGAFRAKVLAGWASMAILVLGTLALHALWTRLASPWGAAADWSLLGGHLALGGLALSGHALGAWAAHLPRAERSVRVGAALLGAASLYTLAAQTSLRWDRGPEPPIARFVLVQLVLAGALLLLAWGLARARLEPGRAPGARHSRRNALLAVLLLGLPVALTPTSLQDALARLAQRGAPRIAFGEDGRPVVQDGGGLPGDDVIFDARSTPLSWADAGPPPLERRFVGQPFDFRPATLMLLGGDVQQPLGWYDQVSRRFRTYVWHGGRATELRTLGLADGAPLPAGALPVFGWDAASVAFVDAASGGAWQLHRTPDGTPRLDEAPLPGGERLVGLERVHWLRFARAGLYEPYGVSDQLLARGETGLWTWTDGGWAPWTPEDDDVLESRFDEAVLVRLQRAGDGLRPRVAVRDERSGELLLEAPAASPGETRVLLAQGLSLARPPLLAVLAALRPDAVRDETDTALDAYTRDVALAGGARPWLLGGALAVAALLALSVRRHLGREPGERGLRAAWTLAVLLLGVPAAIAAGLVEPPRPASRGT